MTERSREHIAEKLGVRRVINCRGRATVVGGSIMAPAVLEAMLDASKDFFDMYELQDRIGERIATLTNNEAAYVTGGAAAGLVLATAACMTGTDPAKIARLPQVDGLLKHEVVIHRFQRNHYDNNLQTAGSRLVEIGSHRFTHLWELEDAIGPQTAAVAYFVGPYEGPNILPLEKVLKVANDRGVPVIVDAAAAIPPASNLWRYTHMGAALAIFSGGKGLGGPQSTGLVVGRKDLINACKLMGSPNYALGRPFKVGKEEMAGLLAAVEHYLDGGENEQRERCEEWANQLVAALSGIPGVTPRRSPVNTNAQPLPEVQVEIDEVALGVTRENLVRRLWDGNPRVYVPASGKSAIVINPDTLKPGEVEIVVGRLRSALQGS